MATGKERFMTNVQIVEDCWFWKAQAKVFRMRKQLHRPAKAAQLLWYGHLPEGKELMHGCGNAKCVNPDHFVIRDIDWNYDILKKKYGKKWLKVLMEEAGIG